MIATTSFTKRKQALMLISAVLLIATIVLANTSLLTPAAAPAAAPADVQVNFDVAKLRAAAEKLNKDFENSVVLASEQAHEAAVAAQKKETAK
jgi:hypothetical protein